LLRFVQNIPKNILFLSTFKKGQKMAKWPNQIISGKQFQKRPNGNPVIALSQLNRIKCSLYVK